MTLTVSDTGEGLRASFVKGAGLTMIEARAKSLGGEARYNLGPGAEIRVIFPCHGPAEQTALRF